MKDHEALVEILKDIKGKFILSYNDCEVVRALYKNFNIKEVEVNYSLNGRSRGKREELLIMNF